MLWRFQVSLHLTCILTFLILGQRRTHSFQCRPCSPSSTFESKRFRQNADPTCRPCRTVSLAANGDDKDSKNNKRRDTETRIPQITGVIAPLSYKGPYPCLTLRFPHLVGQPEFDFIVDTGANLNTVQDYLAQQYNLTRAEGLPVPSTTAGMGGSFAPAGLVVMGDAVLA